MSLIVLIGIALIGIVVDIVVSVATYKAQARIKSHYDKSLAEYTDKHQKYLDVLFRNETARASVVAGIIAKGDNVKIEIYQKVYRLFFKIQRSVGTTDELTKEINDIKNDIILNYIYLGDFIDCLHNIPAYLMDDLSVITSGNARGIQNEYDSEKSYDALLEAGQWIKNNMEPHLTLNSVDLPKEGKDNIREEYNKMVKDFCKNKPNSK
jgi:hypothetical protein